MNALGNRGLPYPYQLRDSSYQRTSRTMEERYEADFLDGRVLSDFLNAALSDSRAFVATILRQEPDEDEDDQEEDDEGKDEKTATRSARSLSVGERLGMFAVKSQWYVRMLRRPLTHRINECI